MPPRLSTAGRAALDTLLTRRAASRTVPAIHFGATTADGPVYLNCAGERVFGDPKQGLVDENTTFQLYSATKLVTAICMLQLSSSGHVDLHSPSAVSTYLPELSAMDVLVDVVDGNPVWEARDASRPVTFAHILSHTSGLGYPHLHPILESRRASAVARALSRGEEPQASVWSGTVEGLCHPPTFQAGTRWQYGLGSDWAGVAVERISGVHMEEYVREHVFGPLGLGVEDISFLPPDSVLDRLQPVLRRTDDGLQRTEFHVTPERMRAANRTQPIGGGGLFGTQKAFLRFLQGVLASSDSARPRKDRVLTPTAYAALFENVLKEEQCYEDIVPMASEMVSNDPRVGKEVGFGHSLAFPVTLKDSPHGRTRGSGQWSGAGQTHYWIDPGSGIAATCFTQLANGPPDPFFEVYNEFERTLYDGLE